MYIAQVTSALEKNSYNTGHNGLPKHVSPKSFVAGTGALSSHLPRGSYYTHNQLCQVTALYHILKQIETCA
jgi:hypothetical protein